MPQSTRTRGVCLAISLLLSLTGLSAAPVMAGEEKAREQGRQLFLEGAQPTCGTCHALEDAGTSGAIGPNLDNLQPTEKAVRSAVRDGVGVMPPFGDSLSDEEIEAIAKYVVSVTQD